MSQLFPHFEKELVRIAPNIDDDSERLPFFQVASAELYCAASRLARAYGVATEHG
jgi:hypothetical protein